MKEIPYATVRQLAYKIKGTGKPAPRFAFFLGAGASRQSGIITAGEMVRSFKEQIIAECCPEDLKTQAEKEKWLQDQDWYKHRGSEYSKLFEKYEPKEIGRQRYIEAIIEGRTPSFGYVVLANLMASNYVHTVITTNFDDLMYSACTGYTDIRPIVYAYGVLASEMRITAPRPKILKVHGDFLYSTLKNIDRETAAQDPNMARQVAQVLGEYGLIVVGYSGGDDSVMQILSQISEKNDLYWCFHRGTKPNDSVKKLLKGKGGFLIEIPGFDEMMDEIRGIVGFSVPALIGSIHGRQNQLMEQVKSSPKYYTTILPELVEGLKGQLRQQEDQLRKIQALDYFVRAYRAYENGEFEQAERLYASVVEVDPGDFKAHKSLGIVYLHREKYEEAVAAVKQAIALSPEDASVHNTLGWAYILKGDLEEAERELQEAMRLKGDYYHAVFNLGLVHALQGRADESRALWKKGLELCPVDDRLNRALYAFAVGETEQGLAKMRRIVQQEKPALGQLHWALADAEVLARSPKPPSGIDEVVKLLRTAVSGKG